MTNESIINRVRKLLALAAEGSGATEAEAALAAARAAEIMEEHGLRTAQLEAGGGLGERRVDDQGEGGAFYRWQPELMAAIAESCFCHCEIVHESVAHGVGYRQRSVRGGFRLIGRESAVVSARVMFDYLNSTVWRLSRESGADTPRWFRRGCAERLGERLRHRHYEVLREQKEKAEAETERQAQSGSGNGTALVVVLEDYALRERDLNDDLRRGQPPGTTAARREESLRRSREQLEMQRRLVAEGVPPEIAWDMVYLNMTRERAEQYEAARSKQEQAPPRRQRKRRDRGPSAQETREQRARDSQSWATGRQTGDEVSLDRQVAEQEKRRIG